MRKKDPPIRVGEGGMVDLAEAAVRQYHPGRGNRGEADTPWHAWWPVEGGTARYRCPCGAWGRRPNRGGAIVEQKNRPSFVHPSPSARGMASGLSIGGKAPSLDDQERRR